MHAFVEDDVPEEWLSDSNIQKYNAEDPVPVIPIEARLAGVLRRDELPEVLNSAFAWIPRNESKRGVCCS